MLLNKITKKKDFYILHFENSEEIRVSEEIIIKYKLLKGKDINEELFSKIKDAEEYSKALNKTLNYISYRLRSKYEVNKYLKENLYSKSTCKKVIDRLVELKYINDLLFANSYLNTQRNINLKGPNYIKNQLKMHQISEDIVDEVMIKYSYEAQVEVLSKLIDKELRLSKKDSVKKLKEKIIRKMIDKGFGLSVINSVLSDIKIEVDEQSLVDNEVDKLLIKLKNKYQDKELKKVIIRKLMNKGFTYDSIISVLNDKLNI